MAEKLGIRGTDYVLEVGFGSGLTIERLAQLAAAGRVAGVDPSAVMVAQARARNAAAIDRGQVELLRAGVDNLPFDEDVFDAGLTINSMQVWPDVAAGLREILRVLKPGGTFAFGFTPFARQRPEGLREMLVAAGFDHAQFAETEEGFYILAERPGRVAGADPCQRGIRRLMVEPNAWDASGGGR